MVSAAESINQIWSSMKHHLRSPWLVEAFIGPFAQHSGLQQIDFIICAHSGNQHLDLNFSHNLQFNNLSYNLNVVRHQLYPRNASCNDIMSPVNAVTNVLSLWTSTRWKLAISMPLNCTYRQASLTNHWVQDISSDSDSALRSEGQVWVAYWRMRCRQWTSSPGRSIETKLHNKIQQFLKVTWPTDALIVAKNQIFGYEILWDMIWSNKTHKHHSQSVQVQKEATTTSHRPCL